MASCTKNADDNFLQLTSAAPESCNGYIVLSQSEYQQFTQMLVSSTAPFDYATAGALWSLAFTFVLGLYLLARSAGTVLNVIRGRT
ncbi:MAG: hypothetical protein C4516_10685 [Oxalobacter sp.]|nr:MAG: hypothetical protein C4516_10685 [Oxalobacter sp.]